MSSKYPLTKYIRETTTIIEHPSYRQLVNPALLAGGRWNAEAKEIHGCCRNDLRTQKHQREVFRSMREGTMLPCSVAQITSFLEVQVSGRGEPLLESGVEIDRYDFFCVIGRDWKLTMVLLYRNARSEEWNKFAWFPEKDIYLPRGSRIFYNS